MGSEPLPAPFASWDERRIRFYRKNVHMIAGKPGSFKTMLALNAVANMGLLTMGFSNDSDDLTVASRLLAMSTGKPAEQMEEWISNSPQEAGQALQRFDYIQWSFGVPMTLDDVWLELYAYHEVNGMWPAVVLIDILKNVVMDGLDEWGSLREVMLQSLVIARETEAAVILVHHCSDGAKGYPVPSRVDVLGKIAGLPAVMVNVGMDNDGDMWAAGVKVRKGKSDPDAKSPFRMSVNPEISRITDYIPQPAYAGYEHGRTADEGQWWK